MYVVTTNPQGREELKGPFASDTALVGKLYSSLKLRARALKMRPTLVPDYADGMVTVMFADGASINVRTRLVQGGRRGNLAVEIYTDKASEEWNPKWHGRMTDGIARDL